MGAIRTCPAPRVTSLLPLHVNAHVPRNDYGARPPLLLGDFAQAYFVCDDYFMLSRRDHWCGLIQRAASGFDLFLLVNATLLDAMACDTMPHNVAHVCIASPQEGFPSAVRDGQHKFPTRYTRLQTWPGGFPDNIKSVVVRLLSKDPDFPLKAVLEEGEERRRQARSSEADIVLDAASVDEVMRNGLSRRPGPGGEGGGGQGNGESDDWGAVATAAAKAKRRKNASPSSSSSLPASAIEGSGWRSIKPARQSKDNADSSGPKIRRLLDG